MLPRRLTAFIPTCLPRGTRRMARRIRGTLPVRIADAIRSQPENQSGASEVSAEPCSIGKALRGTFDCTLTAMGYVSSDVVPATETEFLPLWDTFHRWERCYALCFASVRLGQMRRRQVG